MKDHVVGKRLAAQIRKQKVWEGVWETGEAPPKHGGQERWFCYSCDLDTGSRLYQLCVTFLVKRVSKKDRVMDWDATVEVAFGPKGDNTVTCMERPAMHVRDLIKWATMVAAMHESTLGEES